ncbi:FAD/NAD(P)-binding protein [Microbacterium album]|uniref:FAD-dependent urate hydroxylase HpyO/Asp monooxygenase CreE-like FAD/NAD(P)-binding domain-containing protein n=1 Tax=Microbacterium album TaxID=2053191 RepID=A0A917ICI6_9MICO|nr:FAD/NAD(P)-binding domain-containing protein [Microbacterium album]GGH34603.1 hypothetical protein GCM10010921_02430 [Microbacterium album]
MNHASLAIVGASVRGTALLDRVVASARELLGEGQLDVHVLDPHPPGSGRIWRAGQPQELIMNTVAAQSTVFTDASVRMEGPVRPGPSFAEWCRAVAPGLPLPQALADEAARTEDWSNPSRVLYGHYLRWAFERITSTAPAGVRVTVHARRVTALAPDGTGHRLTLDDGTALRVDAAILALGWLAREGAAPHPRVIGPDNPIDQDLSRIRPGERVVARGLGMNFFDAMSLLTEHRGGRFEPTGTGLRYRPSGREPVILAGSARGVPYRAKPVFGRVPPPAPQPALRAALAELRARRPLDFDRDVLPLIEADARAEHPELSLGDARDPLPALRRAHPDLDIDALVALAVSADAAEAARGLESPLKRALHSYQLSRAAVVDLVAFGGLTPASFPAYRRYLATAASFGSGPPLLRTHQLLALHEAGLVRFLGPGLQVSVADDGVTAWADHAPAVEADWLLEAWLPAPGIEHTADPLLRSLRDAGLARAWRHADGTPSDAVDVRPEDGAVVAAAGDVVPGLFSVGVPHEDNRVFTIIAPIPGVDSPVLREVDAAARAALRHAQAATRRERAAVARGGTS